MSEQVHVNEARSQKSEVRHFDIGGLEGRKAQPFCTFCLAALTLPTLYEIVAYVDPGWQAKALPAGWAALSQFRLSSGKQVLFLLVAGGSQIFNFLRKIHHFRMTINGIVTCGVL